MPDTLIKSIIRATVEKDANGRATIVASDDTVDRSGESIPVLSWDLSNFQKSPRLLIDHDYSVKSIVGIAQNIRVQEGKLVFEPLFHGITDVARQVKEMVDQGFLDTVSVGFLRKQSEEAVQNELMEISFVAVPCNPNARTLAVKDIEPDVEKAVEDFVNASAVQTEAPKEEAKAVEPEVKEGRVLSDKNRSVIQDAIDSMNETIAALQELLDATDPQGDDGDEADDGKGSPKQRSNGAGSATEALEKWLEMRKVLRAVNTATSDALSRAKLKNKELTHSS